jgi:hypothetical protein
VGFRSKDGWIMIKVPIPFRDGSQPVGHSVIESRLAFLRAKQEARDREFKKFLKTVLKVKE